MDMPMEIVFKNDNLKKMESDPSFEGGHPPSIIRAFRKRMQQIRSVLDERDFYSLKSLRFEKLKGSRAHQHSMRLNDQWRLILEIEGNNPRKIVKIVGIEDYH
jgi:proteic killer suppression protein